MAAILSRLFLVLALALWGAHPVGAQRPAAHNGSIVADEATFAPVILTAQSHLIPAPFTEGDTPQSAEPTSGLATPQQKLARVSWRQAASAFSAAVNVLPPVRGPPAV